jgi:hypothetical protein
MTPWVVITEPARAQREGLGAALWCPCGLEDHTGDRRRQALPFSGDQESVWWFVAAQRLSFHTYRGQGTAPISPHKCGRDFWLRVRVAGPSWLWRPLGRWSRA